MIFFRRNGQRRREREQSERIQRELEAYVMARIEHVRKKRAEYAEAQWQEWIITDPADNAGRKGW